MYASKHSARRCRHLGISPVLDGRRCTWTQSSWSFICQYDRAGMGECSMCQVGSGLGWIGREVTKTMTAFGPHSDQAESLHVAATHRRCEVGARRAIARWCGCQSIRIPTSIYPTHLMYLGSKRRWAVRTYLPPTHLSPTCAIQCM